MSASNEPLTERQQPTIALQPGVHTRATTQSRLRLRWKPQLWMQWIHRWATLTLGIVLLVTTFSGTVALFAFDLNRLAHPLLYHATPAATPVSLDTAQAAVVQGIANDPLLKDRDVHPTTLVARPGDSYQFYLADKDEEDAGLAFVDPGTGAYLGSYESESTIWGWFVDLHTELFSDKIEFTYPEWVPAWVQTAIGANLAELMLKNVALLLLIMVITGAYLWWPGIRKLAYGIQIRRGVKGYAWHYDWHKVLGFVSLPFLLMWAITGLNFYEPYTDGIAWSWYALTWTSAPPEWPEDLQSKPNGGAMISADNAKQRALAAVPDTRFVSVTMPTVITGTVNIWLGQGIDPYEHGEFPGQVNIVLDAYSGAVLDNSTTRDTSWAAYIYEWWFYPIHAGVPVAWPVRLIWAFFGLMPTFLAFTGVMQWWLKRKKHKERSARRQSISANTAVKTG